MSENHSIVNLAASIRTGDMSSLQLVEHCASCIESLDGKLNAFHLLCKEKALEQARFADQALRSGNDLGVLHG
ncbi:MAG: amidase family protein, partial [Desulfobacterales bacterium]